MTERRLWSQDETKMAFVLYCRLAPGEISPSNPLIKDLAKAIGRTPKAVKAKLHNIGGHDANRVAAGFSGLAHGSTYDGEIWNEFYANPERFIEEASELLAKALSESSHGADRRYMAVELPPEGKERMVTTSQRINQDYFRNTLLTNYKGKCCMTGIDMPQLLVASHIKPWKDSDPKTERLLASNGLLLNAFHDRAFDKGLISINNNLEVIVSPKVAHNEINDKWLYDFEGQKIARPAVMPPDARFIEYHNDVIFKSA